MSRLFFVRWSFAVVVVLAACRGDGRSPDRQPAHPVQQGSATVQPESAAGSGAAQAGSALGNAEPATPPPGDAKLVAAPPDIAGKIAVKEIARGLKRPVLLVAAPG